VKLPDPGDTLAVARWLEAYPPKLRDDLLGYLMLSDPDPQWISGAIAAYEGKDREDYPGTRKRKRR
jgi:hypothetical protein